MEREERKEERSRAEQAAQEAGDHIPGRRGLMFGETLKTLNRLNSSYRRCHWKSATELIFPLLYGHLTLASHRTWKLFVKKAVFNCYAAWREQYGESVLYAIDPKTVNEDPVMFHREGVDAVQLRGWRVASRVDEDSGEELHVYIGPGGQICISLADAFAAFEEQSSKQRSMNQRITIAQAFLQMHANTHSMTENVDRSGEGDGAATNLRALQATGEDVAVTVGASTISRSERLSVTTSSLEDYLYRGDDPLVAGMSWATYGTWVYRIELPVRPEKSVRAQIQRYVDVPFDKAYKLHGTHAQRITTEPRVPMFEGFTMPALTVDSERNAMYKQVQCRPTRRQGVLGEELSEEQLVLRAFALFSSPRKSAPGMGNSEAATTAFTRAYLEWEEDMVKEAAIARFRFADRFEYPSLWETEEMVARLEWQLQQTTDEELVQPMMDPDRSKPRATVAQYSSMLAESRVAHLEGWVVACFYFGCVVSLDMLVSEFVDVLNRPSPGPSTASQEKSGCGCAVVGGVCQSHHCRGKRRRRCSRKS